MGEDAREASSSPAHADRPRESSTDIPARLERLPWGRFHMLVVVALGITWILDGLEVTLAGSVAGALKESPALRFSDATSASPAAPISLGAVVGRAGLRLAHRPARAQEAVLHHHRRLPRRHRADRPRPGAGCSFFLFRFLTGCGIGGEYTAINSTIQELVPARYRGLTDLVINGSFWIGAALGALVADRAAQSARIDPETGLARSLPDRRGARPRRVLHADVDPREPALAGHPRPRGGGAKRSSPASSERFAPQACAAAGRRECRDAAAHRARTRRSARCSPRCFARIGGAPLVGLALMAAQAFFYNAIFFTYALVLTKFYDVPLERRRLVHPAFRDRQFPRARAARPPVRHARPARR